MTSVKKHDTMIGQDRTQAEGPLPGTTMDSTDTFFMWCPTARAKAGRSINATATRSSDEVFWRGVSERISFESGGSGPWMWRRIVFTKKALFDSDLISPERYVNVVQDVADISTETTPVPVNPGTVSGLLRYNRSLDPLPVAQYTNLTAEIFRGVRFIDWSNYLDAPLNRDVVNVITDKTVRIASGNDTGVLRQFKLWVPLNKRMKYGSNEEGTLDIQSQFAANAATDTNVLDDVYIVDYFRQQTVAPGTLNMSTTTTVYWHER